MPYWWDDDPFERYWLEITDRDDIGGDLWAPLEHRSGGLTASYQLVPEVKVGDTVVHYDSGSRRIVGTSRAAGPPREKRITWSARGTVARRAGDRPIDRRGISVPLDDFAALERPLDLDRIRGRGRDLMAVRATLRHRYGKRTALYYPWVPYGATGPIRTMQSYLCKLPREVLPHLPELGLGHGPADMEELVGELFKEWAVRPSSARRGRGQGFSADPEVNAAIEAYAMDKATTYYGTSWHINDVHANSSYDLKCTKLGMEKHVEVKGTRSDGMQVLLTPNEVTHAREYPDVALFIVYGVEVDRTEDGEVVVSGGAVRKLDPWIIDDGAAVPVGYKYEVPLTPGA